MSTLADPSYDAFDTFEEMVFALAHHDQPTVAFVECASLAKRNELETLLQQRLPEYKFHTIDITPFPVVSLLRTLNEQLPTEVKDSPPVTYVVNVHGLENSLLVSQNGQIVPSRMTAQLNLERELLYRSVPYIIILWGDTQFFRTLQREAPDLWHWVTYKFRFEDPDAQPAENLPPLPPERLPQEGNITERQQRIRELNNRYDQLSLNTSDKKRLLKDKINILSLLGQEYTEAFEYAAAEKAYRTAIALQETIQVKDGGQLLFLLATVYMKHRHFAEALATCERCMAVIAKEYHGLIYHRIGQIYQMQRQWEAALDNYQQALKWKQQTGGNLDMASTYHQIGTFYQEQRQWTAALENYQQALKWKQQTGDNYALGNTYHHIAMVYAEQRQWAAALDNYQQAIKWDKQTGSNFTLGVTYHQIGMVYEEQRQWAAALENYQQALSWKQKTGNDFELATTYHQIGRVYEEQQQWAAALENYRLALKWEQQTSNDFALGGTSYQMGFLYEKQKLFKQAVIWFEKAVDSMTEHDHPFLCSAKNSLARVRAQVMQKAS